MTYTLLGDMTIVPQADLENLVSRANRTGDRRVGGDALGKRAGMEVLCSLTSGSTLEKVMALGPKSSDAWRVVDGSANFTPVNLSTWTASAGCSYSTTTGVLVADGVDNPTATQDVVLKAGKYTLRANGGGEGTYNTDYHTAKLIISGGTDGVLITKVWNTSANVDATVDHAFAHSDKEEYVTTFTLTVDQTVTFKLDVVNEAAALEAGQAYIKLALLESA